MTAVVGILNKRGVAIAADSAVTRTRGRNEKVTKNGNKMLRVSNAVPVSVMLTGNANYMRNPWDVIVRLYRRERGDVVHPTVEACVHDFFGYVASNDLLWNDSVVNEWVKEMLEGVINSGRHKISWKDSKQDRTGNFVKPKTYQKLFLKQLKLLRTASLKNGVCPQFKDYSIEQFRGFVSHIVDQYFEKLINGDVDTFYIHTTFPREFLDAVREDVESTLFAELTTRSEHDSSATLVFSGFGAEQEYPSLVSTVVCEGFDHRVNYHIRGEDIICISEERPVAVCPFAQRDVILAILRGQHRDWSGYVYHNLKELMENAEEKIFIPESEEPDFEFISLLHEFNYSDLFYDKIHNKFRRLLDKNQREWEKTLMDYDVKSMAALAESLIDLTGFQRILTFQQEGVGGPVDVAVITKNDGFTWLNRKSWYHHKDVNGQYGSLGI